MVAAVNHGIRPTLRTSQVFFAARWRRNQHERRGYAHPLSTRRHHIEDFTLQASFLFWTEWNIPELMHKTCTTPLTYGRYSNEAGSKSQKFTKFHGMGISKWSRCFWHEKNNNRSEAGKWSSETFWNEAEDLRMRTSSVLSISNWFNFFSHVPPGWEWSLALIITSDSVKTCMFKARGKVCKRSKWNLIKRALAKENWGEVKYSKVQIVKKTLHFCTPCSH